MTLRLFIISTFFITSCTDPSPANHQAASPPTDHSLILGVSPFDTYLEVSRNSAFDSCTERLVFLKGDELLGVKALCEIKVVFDDSLVTHIDADIFPSSAAETNLLWMKIYDHISSEYGKTSYDDGFAAWHDLTLEDKKFEIQLTNDSREVGKPYIGLVCDEK